jgi:ADP-ribosylglycohydrolase/DNA-directed RNA polymerase subunit F
MTNTDHVEHPAPSDLAFEQIYGALLGAAMGDALGWPYEQNSGRIGPHSARGTTDIFQPWRRRAGGKYLPHELDIGAGEYSDDTQLLLATARSLIGYTNWGIYLREHELPLWSLYERGGGGATKRAADSWRRGISPWKNNKLHSQYFSAGGNGVAMRVLPHVLIRGQTPVQLARDVLRNGIITHGHPRALLGARVYAQAAWWLAHERSPLAYGSIIEAALESESFWAQPPERTGGNDVSSSSHWMEAADLHFKDGYLEAWKTTVEEVRRGLLFCRQALTEGALTNDDAVLDSLGCFRRDINGSGVVAALAVLYLFAAHAADPMVGLRTIAYARSTDTDTLASMLGGLFGLSHRLEWMPDSLQRVQDRSLIEEIAGQLVLPNRSVVEVPAGHWSDRDEEEVLRNLEEKAPEVVVGVLGKSKVVDDRQVRTMADNVVGYEWQLRTQSSQTIFIKRMRKLDRTSQPARSSAARTRSRERRVEGDQVNRVQTSYDLYPNSADAAEQTGRLSAQQLQAFGDMLLSLTDILPQNMRSTIMLKMVAHVVSAAPLTAENIRSILEDYRLELTADERARCLEVFVKYLCT